MGLVKTALTLSNMTNPSKTTIETALVDTGALMLGLPIWVAEELGFDLDEYPKKIVILADGSKQTVPYVAPVRVSFHENRTATCGAIVMGDEVILGAIPMEEMDVLVHPTKQALIPNPDNPNFPVLTMKGHKVEYQNY